MMLQINYSITEQEQMKHFQNAKDTSRSSKLAMASAVDLSAGTNPAFDIWSRKNLNLRAISPHRLIFSRYETINKISILYIVNLMNQAEREI